MKRPNILWYCTDQQRFDTIASLGNEHINTPVLDRLAESGVAFTRAYTQAPICTPSRASFLTGRYPAAHHVHRNGNDFFPQSERLVTKILADAGYDCALAGKLHLSRAKGRVELRPDDGYRSFNWSHHPAPDWGEGHAYETWLRDDCGVDPVELFASYRDKPYGVPEKYHQTTWCTEMAIGFIDEPRDGPWLVSLNPFDPHPPFDAPESYLDRYDPATLPPPIFDQQDIVHQQKYRDIDQQSRISIDPNEATRRVDADAGDREALKHDNDPNRDRASDPPKSYDPQQIKASYYGMIELIDTQLGRILDHLEERGELDNTIIIFTSDHGELLGDHGLLFKGCRFFEGLVHVPLIMCFPGNWRPGSRANGLVELVDLAPTILDAVGLPIPPEMQGTSLVPVLEGRSNGNKIKPYVVSEYWDAVECPDGHQDHTHATMYFDGRYKSIVYHGHDLGELYDLETDPDEIDDLWGKPAASALKQEIILRHLDAYAKSTWPGIERTSAY
jgi:arylsulfatase